MRTFKFLPLLLLMACFSLEASSDTNPGNIKGEKVSEFLISSTQFINGTTLLIPLNDTEEITINLQNAKQNKRGVLRFSVYVGDELAGTAIVKGKKFRANINYGESQYRIAKSKKSNTASVLKYAQNPSMQEHPELHDGQGSANDLTAESITGSVGGRSFDIAMDSEPEESIVRVLVAYTTAADQASDDIESLIDLAFAETNIAFSASDVPHTLELAGTLLIEDYVENADIGDILDDLKAKNDGIMDEVHTARRAANADMVALIIDQPEYCGIAFLNASYTSAFSVVHYSCATGYYSFGHEIGHNLALRHNVEVDDATAPFSDGHGYQSPAQDARTVMSYNCEDYCTRYPLFSNPEVNFPTGDAAGDLSIANNARILNLNMPQFSKFDEMSKEGELAWEYTSGSNYGFYSHPVMDETMTFTSDSNGILHAFDNQTGDVLWTIEDDKWHYLSLFGEILYASNRARTFAVQKATGVILWEHLNSNYKKQAVDGDGNLYTLDYLGITKFSPAGSVLNTVSISGRVSGADPLINIDKQLIYVMTQTGVVAYALDDLSLVWNTAIPTNVESTSGYIIMDHDTVFHYLAGKNLAAVNSSTGALLWQREGESDIYATDPPIMDAKHIYHSSGSEITAFSKITGDIVWNKPPSNSDIIATGTSVIAIRSNQYSLLNINTGDIETTYSLDAVEADTRAPALSPSGLLTYQDNNGIHVYQTAEFAQSDLVWGMTGANLSRTYSIQQVVENSAPVLEIHQPLNNAVFKYSDAIVLSATALDEEDGDISGNIRWESDLDGEILSPQKLSAGQHTITATIEDSGNKSVTQSETITIVNTSDLTVSLTSVPDESQDEWVTLDVLIVNMDAFDSTNTVIELQLPEGISFISANNAEDCSTVILLVTCQVVDIAPNAKHIVRFVVSTGEVTDEKFEYQVVVSADNDLEEGNNRSTHIFGGSIGFIILLLLLILAMGRKTRSV